MRDSLKKTVQLPFLFIFLIIAPGMLSAQDFYGDNMSSSDSGFVIDYFGVISKDLDANMSVMVSDLYYTQLSEIPNFSVIDKRITPLNARPTNSDISNTENTIFYTEIVKNESEETWTLTYIVLDKTYKQKFSKDKKYDSFYKILMESKNELEVSVKELIAEGTGIETAGNKIVYDDSDYNNIFNDEKQANNISNVPSQGHTNTGVKPSDDSNNNVNLENVKKNKVHIKSVEMLSGTWKGDSSIDKIVILRGGRGFIIFKNGASMNITVTLEDNNGDQTINIKQKGNSNASFYPELPRKIALAAAISAPPMEWSMVLLDNMVMEGTKTTLVQDNESFKLSEVPVSWIKIN